MTKLDIGGFMKIEYSNDIDSKLVRVISHEYLRCQLSFNQFKTLSELHIIEEKKRSIELNILTYNAYLVFIHHLYEFLIACFKRDMKSLKKIDFKVSDRWLNGQVDRILSNHLQLIDSGKAPKYFNQREFYTGNCPEEFGKQFRRIRNLAAHADHKRTDDTRLISLSKFYDKYHKYIYLIFKDCDYWWSIKTLTLWI